MRITCIPEVKHGVDDLIVGLPQAQHDGGLCVHPTILGRPQHLQALHVPRTRVSHPPLNPPATSHHAQTSRIKLHFLE